MRRALIAVLLVAGSLVGPALASAQHSTGTPTQIAWVRRAAGNFLAAELQGNGAGACGVLEARLRGTVRGRTCAQRWNASLATMRQDPGRRDALRADRRAVASAVVVVSGDHATIALPHPLLAGSSRFLWTEMCWMLQR